MVRNIQSLAAGLLIGLSLPHQEAGAALRAHYLDLSERAAKVCADREDEIVAWESGFRSGHRASDFTFSYIPSEPNCLWIMFNSAHCGYSIRWVLDSAGVPGLQFEPH